MIISYTTGHELAYLRDLAKRHRWAELQSTLETLDRRSWAQPGMSVDVSAVRKFLIDLLRKRP